MKGFTKAIKRTPHFVTTKVGMSKKSNDPEFDDYQSKFTTIEDTVEKLLKDCKKFNEAVTNLFTAGQGFAVRFAATFRPLPGEFDLLGQHPEAAGTLKNVDSYQVVFEELRANIVPELELIESRIIAPVKELQSVMKSIRKNITKRDHKLIDYDRYNNSLAKLRDKKEKSLNDEKNLFKLEQDFENAMNDYEYINNAMKQDLPHFLALSIQFVDPLYHSFYYMQLNIFYMIMEKLNSFAEGKYEVHIPVEQIVPDYEEKRSDASHRIEEMKITKRIVSTAKMMQESRSAQGSGVGAGYGGGTGAAASSTSLGSGSSLRAKPPIARSVSSSSLGKKAPPPPPPAGAPPPPYSPASSGSGSGVAATKRAPPPPPPLKPKPKPKAEIVVALYDFEPQANGDLGFHAGDKIEVIKRTPNKEEWWTGRLNGKEGDFPGNYVQET